MVRRVVIHGIHVLFAGLALASSGWQLAAFADDSAEGWTGEWVTDLGLMKLEQFGQQVSGSYGAAGEVEGSINGDRFEGAYMNGASVGSVQLSLKDNREAFAGAWRNGPQTGAWRGWKKNPQATEQPTADFSGVWLSSLGVMQLTQQGEKVTGSYGAEGWSNIEGTVKGRRLKLTWNRIQWSGPAWIEQTASGERFFGMTEGANPNVWLGLKLKGFDHHAPGKAAQLVEGRTDKGMLYYLRMPDGWTPGEPTDVVVLLHGSNWTTQGMVAVTARNWPEIGRRFAILGIQGQNWATWSEPPDLRFNYTYVNWMGRSTYQGYPYTDRESPYLANGAIDELAEQYNFNRVFVGGHSQGGFLAYLLHMHYPRRLAGTFPIAGGLVVQAEPDVFKDEDLQTAQRALPMAIVHGRADQVVPFSIGMYAFNRFKAHDFHRAQLFSPELGHPYDFLPIGQAIVYLDAMSTPDAAKLLAYAEAEAEKKSWRTVGAALARADELDATEAFKAVREAYESAAAEHASDLLTRIRTNESGDWIDEYLDWQDQFALSRVGATTVKAFEKLRRQHDGPAGELQTEAKAAFRAGKREEGWQKYQEIVDKYYASRLYRTTREQLKGR